MENYVEYNAKNVLKKVNYYLEELTEQARYFNFHYRTYISMDKVYKDLSIFDWWKDHLSITDLKNMKHFLETAIEYGFDGYVCFKVGVSGCANGMWAHRVPSTDGYSPNGDCLYRSFTPAYTEWDVVIDDKCMLTSTNTKPTLRNVKKILENRYCNSKTDVL